MITVGQETVTAKRDLSNIFPAEIVNRKILNQYIQYILNNFFEQSKEKIVASYVGTVVESFDGTETYLREPTVERQLNQIIPVLKTGDEKITFNNYMSDLRNEGCTIYDQNKLLANKFWSWCPPVNADMFTNFVNYYWIGYPFEENNILIFDEPVDVIEDIIGQPEYTYIKYNEYGEEIERYTLQDGDVVVFPNDTSKTYNAAPYRVSNPSGTYINLLSLSVPLIIIYKQTNVVADILDKKNYTMKDEERNFEFKFLNGMRIRFINDENADYNNSSFMVYGVGDAIKLVEDNYNPYLTELDDIYSIHTIDFKNDDGTITKRHKIFEPDYFVMERGSIDGNDWSRLNRWVQRKSIEAMNIGSLEGSAASSALQHAAKPIICFNKDIELYNSGSFDRGYVKYAINIKSSDIIGTNVNRWISSKYNFETGDKILLLKNIESSSFQLFTVRIVDDIIYLDTLINGQTDTGETTQGDSVKVTDGDNAGKIFYYNGYEWTIGQVKEKINQKPLFNLYDVDKVLLNNTVNYPNSTFEGCTLFQYQQSNSVINDVDVGMPIIVDEDDTTNYHFESTLNTEKYYYTPENDFQKEIIGYRLYKNIRDNSYLNDWHLSSSNSSQYLRTMVEVLNSDNFNTMNPNLYELELKYKPAENTTKKSLIITVNDIELESYDILPVAGNNMMYRLKGVKVGDTIVVRLIPEKVEGFLEEDYVYEYPLSLTVNQFNKNIDYITYNDAFNQMTDIIGGQTELEGSPIGSNNYTSIVPDVSVGTKIIQSSDSVVRSMVLNNNPDTSIRGSIDYAMNSYIKFKQKYLNLVEKEIIKGTIVDNEEQYQIYSANIEELDDTIISIIKKINIGKEGLMPFYNNGVITIMENAYIPSTPAYLGVANCYEPRIDVWEDFTTDEKPTVVIGHDGSLYRATGSVKDLFVLRLEELIYQSIENKFKDTRCGINIYEFIPGKFRDNTYTRQEYLNVYSPSFEQWCNDKNITYSENTKFKYDSLLEDETCWKTWNYTGCETLDGEPVYGSYRALYMYFYDTYRPDTHPWEMLGFGDEPSWWEDAYGAYPYTSANIIMWKDIENGIIKEGPWKGEYKELKRPGLFETYLPVDENGKLKNPYDAHVVSSLPTVQMARKKWVIGDIGDVEFGYLQTSESKFANEITNYMLRPVNWLETNWNTLDRETLFKGTNYEQIIDSTTNTREDISKIVMHNEYIDNKYVRKIGAQQWISDYLSYEKIDITKIADEIRNSDVCLGYRCSGFYKKDSVEIITDAYGVLPSENVHIDLFDSKRDRVFTYSGMQIIKTKRGYEIDGFDVSDPYFRIKEVDTNGKYSTITVNDKVFYYYHQYKSGYKLIPYRTEFTSMQEVYNVIIGYGKYLTEEENWYFSTLAPDGTVLDFRTSGESFCKWATLLKGDAEDALLMLNPGSLGIGNYNSGMVDDIDEKIAGYASVRDIYGLPVEKGSIDVYRQAFNTYFSPKNDLNIALIKFKTYDLEHIITFDNVTVYNNVLYNSTYSAQLDRFKLYGVKVLNWYGTLYAPGYIVRNEGAIPNYDKTVNDLQYMFDVDDVHCKGKYAEYSRGIVGYQETKTYKDLYLNEKSMFDFYKGSIRHKGTKGVLEKMNRSSNISSTGNNIELYEQWAFKEGQFGHIKDNSVDEFILDTKKMIQNPQVITFETATNYYFDRNKKYNSGDVCIYNNYEYVAKINGIYGKFDPSEWKKIRYVGNYIIFNEDPKWIKKSKTMKVNCFKYTDNLIVNPIGGFAKTNECGYIVADDDAANELLKDINVGDTVWVVKTKLGDWDVLKKTGIAKYVSMRYFSIADAIKQPEEEFVYHFTDDKIDYYSTKNSENIDIADNVYNDIDVNFQECKWGDITIPEYTGETGLYVTGTDYKVKMYNTVFKTMVQQYQLNNGTPFTDIYGGATVSYSNLLLNMTQFGKKTYSFKWCFTITADTKAKDVKITINDVVYTSPKNNMVEMIVCEGDILRWTVSAHACGSRSGVTKVKKVDSVVYGWTEQQWTQAMADTEQAKETRLMYNLDQPLNVSVPLSYRKDEIIYQSNGNRDTEEIILTNGIYDMSFVGAGGGGGGGVVHVRHHGHLHGTTYHYYLGNPGASGSYLRGSFNVEEDSGVAYYNIVTGKAGNGGGYASNGANGGNTGLLIGNDAYIYAQSGSGGGAAFNAGGYVSGRKCGIGGQLQSNSELLQRHFIKSNDSRNGNNGASGGAKSVYPTGSYGAGGAGGYGFAGKPGKDGFGKVVFKTCSNYDDYSKFPSPSAVTFISKELSSTDSLEYTAYSQPYVIPYSNDEVKYFFSYDVLHEDEIRPDASIVSPSSSFYKYRSKSVTAYHKNTVNKNLWTGPNYEYKNGDTVSVKNSGSNTFKYYICVYNHISGNSFELTREISGQTITLWEEYAPTYYYKITYNTNPIETEDPTQDPTNPRYSGADYELYLDAQCTQRAEKNNAVGDGDFLMNCSDLDFNRKYIVGSSYTLVDKFATYSQLTPRYLSEPSWGTINQVGTYEISSGNISYFENADEETIRKNPNSYVYSDMTCDNVVKSIKPVIIDDNSISYEEVDMKYPDIINTVTDHKEISYEMKDKDQYLYTSKSKNEITDDTEVFGEFELLNSSGIYKDYIPVWETTDRIPNGYQNEIKYIHYEPIDESTDIINTGATSYKVTITDGNKEIYLAYKDVDQKYKSYCAPSQCDTSTGLITTDVTLYRLADYFVESHDDMINLTNVNETDICIVESDSESNIKNAFYRYISGSWNLLGSYSDVCKNDSIFESRIYSGDNIFIKNIETNKSILYPELIYNKQVLSGNDVIVDNSNNANVNLYFNEQSVGKHVVSGNVVQSSDDTDDIRIFIDSRASDPMYLLLEYMCDEYNSHISEHSVNPHDLYVTYIGARSSNFFYLDEQEALRIFDTLDTPDGTKDKNKYNEPLPVHTCKIFNMYRNVDGNIQYTKLYLYGEKLYSKRYIQDEITSDSYDIGVYYGNMKDLTEYTRIDYEYSSAKSYTEGDLCTYNDVAYECIRNINTGIQEYDTTEHGYNVGDICWYKIPSEDGEPENEAHGYICISDVSIGSEFNPDEWSFIEFNEEDWKLYVRDKIVNVISYKEFNDLIYITSDNFAGRIIKGIDFPTVSDTNFVSNTNGTLSSEGKKGWMKIRYIDREFMFDLVDLERRRLAVDTIKSCYLVDNSNDNTMIKVQVFDPVQNMLPNEVLDEINYISSTDPVNDYSNQGKWNDNKLGFLWWDTSKVRYVDYYQGDFEYRRNNWGKQLPGSEIAIMEWTRDVVPPEVGVNYVEKSSYNVETSTIDTYYYFWKKNPIAVPNTTFRKTSAYHIAEIINDPTGQGIVWMSPIDSDVSGRNDNTMIITNFTNVMTGQEAVLQLNTDSDKEIMDHTEWVMVKENTNDNIPEWLWEKMADSLLGYKTIDGEDMPVPAEDLVGRQRLGIAFRPRQTMFNNLYNARENFVDVINDIFASRNNEQMTIDRASGLENFVDEPEEGSYYDEAGTMIELMSWKDESLIGKRILVRHDETHDNIWVIYVINRGFTYSIVDYQEYNIKKYINYIDWYKNDSIKYLTPVYTEYASATTAKEIASGEIMIPGANRYIKDGEIVKYETDDEWMIYQRTENADDASEIVGQSSCVMQLDSSLYDYVNEGINDKDTYIELFKQEGDFMVKVKDLTKYDYIGDETVKIFKVLLDYVNVQED